MRYFGIRFGKRDGSLQPAASFCCAAAPIAMRRLIVRMRRVVLVVITAPLFRVHDGRGTRARIATRSPGNVRRSKQDASAAAVGPARTRVTGALLSGLENREHALVWRIGEFRRGIGADLVRLVARELMAFLIDERLRGTEVDGAMSFE